MTENFSMIVNLMTGRRALLTAACALLLLPFFACKPRSTRVVIGSKNFTEQLVLGELLAQHLESRGLPVERRFYLAGTYICHQAILAGRIDLYVEYTGTALSAVLKHAPDSNPQAVYDTVRSEYARRFALQVGRPLGFENTFAIMTRGADARQLGIHTISEAAAHSSMWRAGFGYEFMERPDGYPGLARIYGLEFAAPPRVMDLGLLARALRDRQIDLAAGNTTDGLIPALDLFVLRDDRHYFPPYQAVPIVRSDALQRFPQLGDALDALAGRLSEQDMQRLNYAVDGEHKDVADVVRDFRREKGL
jgi:osmoprotectant transport system substrate-binding protein